jgi:hypothetical protein
MWEKMVDDEISQTVPKPPRGKAGQGKPFLMKNITLTKMVAEIEKRFPGSVRDRAPLGWTVRPVIESSKELERFIRKERARGLKNVDMLIPLGVVSNGSKPGGQHVHQPVVSCLRHPRL